MKRNKIHQGIVVLITLLTFNLFAFYYIKPYVINKLGLDYKEAGWIVIACYISFIYGLITMGLLHWLEKGREIKK